MTHLEVEKGVISMATTLRTLLIMTHEPTSRID